MEETQPTPSAWVKIISKPDGHSFIVPREVAMYSGFLKRSLSHESGFAESSINTCEVEERAIIVEKVIEYLQHKNLYAKAGPREEIPDFQERIPAEIALELLMASDFLEA